MKYHRGIMKYVISVSKTYKHRGDHSHKSKTKKFWFVYYYDEEGKLRSEKINWLQALYYKTQKRHRLQYVCTECGEVFLGLVKSYKETVDCPYCNQ